MKEHTDRLTKEMHEVCNFVNAGILHGTLPEAIHWALTACIAGEASSVQEALGQAAHEWYK